MNSAVAARAGVIDCWLNALDGVAYLADADGVIVGAGGAGWPITNERSGAGCVLQPEAVLGLNLFSLMSGADVRGHFRKLHASIFAGLRSLIGFEFRCDAPDIKRTMRMSISLLDQAGDRPLALYQSQILSAVSRPWMTVFEPDRILETLQAEARFPIVTMCSICERIAWPTQPTGESRSWLEAEEYYHRGGLADVRISHTVCQSCTDVLPDLFASFHKQI